jgi:hypothetical protein
MNDQTTTAMPECPPTHGMGPVVFLVSASALAFEVSLMRMLLVAGWHHFAFLVISVALLGFGGAGVALFRLRARMLPRGRAWLFVLAWAAALAMPLCAAWAQRIPISSRFLPALLARQMAAWAGYWAVLAIPFLFAAAAIGWALLLARDRVPSLYAANLAGSGVGAILVNGLMIWFAPAALPAAAGAFALAGALCAPGVRHRWKALAAGSAVALIALGAGRTEIRVDLYKYRSMIAQLERQGHARLVASRHGPEGVFEVFDSALFHDIPFLSGSLAPPPMQAVLHDGHWVAPVLDARTPADAAAMGQVLSAAAYELAPPHPHVLLTGELGGAHVWLALWHGAARVEAAHPYAGLHRLLTSAPGVCGGAVWAQPGVRYVPAEPRHFLDHTRGRYDVIHLVGSEALAAGSGGMAGLGQDVLLTVEGLTAALERLTPEGMLVITRGIQDPPRDNLKLMALAVAALRRMGVEEPGGHVVIVRDFLAVCTLIRSTPWTEADAARVEAMLDRRGWTGVWHPGIAPGRRNQPDRLPGPPGSDDDWYHTAAQRLFASEAEARAFIRGWLFDIRPPTDARPFFHDFSRLRAVRTLREAFGDLWLTRAELAMLFVGAALVGCGLLAVALLLAPLPRHRPAGGYRALGPTGGYFACLGLGYLMIEITLLSKLTRLIGDPVRSASVVIAAFLLWSGLGSWTAQRWRATAVRLRWGAAGLAVIALALLFGMGAVIRWAGGWPTPARMLLAALLVGPPAWLMGFPMPTGLRRLQQSAPEWTAWAWGVNGFASVLAAPAAILLAMTWSYPAAFLAALALYGAAATLYERLPAK